MIARRTHQAPGLRMVTASLRRVWIRTLLLMALTADLLWRAWAVSNRGGPGPLATLTCCGQAVLVPCSSS